MFDMATAVDSKDPADLADAELEEQFAQIHRALQAMEVRRSRLLAEIDRWRTYAGDGYLSASSWVTHSLRLSHTDAAAAVRMARALDGMPRAREALASGEISTSAGRRWYPHRCAGP